MFLGEVIWEVVIPPHKGMTTLKSLVQMNIVHNFRMPLLAYMVILPFCH